VELARGPRDRSSTDTELGSLTKKDLFYPIERLIKVLPKLEIPTKQLSQIRFFHLLFVLDNDSAKKEKSFLSPTGSKFTMDLTKPLFSASGNPLCRSFKHLLPLRALHCHTLPLTPGCCFSPLYQHPIEAFGSSSHLALNLFSLRD
jgi:hypothetical protein